MLDVQFSISQTGCDRMHHIVAEDVRVVLSRLPSEARERLRTVHFNDRSRGGRSLGYVNQGRREIALCALPPRMSLTRFLVNGQTPKQFGARRGEQWPALAIRRFMLYDVLLHELGHLQIVDDRATSVRRRFSMETKAQEFAMRWCKQLWAVPFDHSDAVHNKPTDAELADKEPETTHALAQVRQHPDSAELFQRLGKIYFKRRMTVDAKSAFEKSLVLDPRDPWSNLYLGKCHYVTMQLPDAVKCYARAAELMPDRSAAWWCLAEAYEKDRKDELADMHYRKAVEAEPSDKVARRKLTAWRQRLAHRGP